MPLWFWSKVNKDGPIPAHFPELGNCWLWTAADNGTAMGYGVFGRGGHNSQDYAHRVAWEMAFGAIPSGILVLHKCDTPRCVRNDEQTHLMLGTQADNVADMIRKGRDAAHNIPGFVLKAQAARTKLTWPDVREIRSRHAAGEMVRALAPAFGMGETQIYNIVRNKVWLE